MRARRRVSIASTSVRKRTISSCGSSKNRLIGNDGGIRPRAMVVILTVAVPLPVAKVLGLAEQVVFAAAVGREQNKVT